MRDQWLRIAFLRGIGYQRQVRALSECVFPPPTAGWLRTSQRYNRCSASTNSDLYGVFDAFDARGQSVGPLGMEYSHAADIAAETLPQPKQRRVRYSGKYPRNFDEKYKELSNDEKTIQKVMSKGNTPAGRHLPIMVNECLYHLGLSDATTNKNNTSVFYVDCTLGYGGHASTVLQRLLQDDNSLGSSWQHQVVCFDRDPVEIIKATERLNNIILTHQHNEDASDSSPPLVAVSTVNRNFCEVRSHLDALLGHEAIGKVTALLVDLGLSSMQIDDASRGFTYKREGPLDMRMSGKTSTPSNDTVTESANDLLSRLTVKEFTKLLQENSDEEYASVIAQAVVGTKPVPSTTVELAHRVRDAVRPHLSPLPRKSTATSRQVESQSNKKKKLDATVARVMQAIRIQVNEEFEALEALLHDLPYILAPGGRAVFLTFHSGEDRRVKKAFKAGFNAGLYSSWSRDVVRPAMSEQRVNPRSSCCKLRWVVRSDQSLRATATSASALGSIV
jgi:16S rRNA (cytosine1402-N4)-methyltransferase